MLLLRSTFIVLALVALWIVWSIWPEKPLHEVWVDGNWSPRFLVADGKFVWGQEDIPNQSGTDIEKWATSRWRSVRLSDGLEVFSIDVKYWPLVINRGRSVIINRPARHIDVYNIADGRLISSIPDAPHQKNRSVVGYGRSKYVVVGDYEQLAGHELWDVESGTKLRDVQRTTEVDFGGDGEIMVQRFDHEWTLVETATDRIIFRSTNKLLIDNADTALRPDGKALAIHTHFDDHITVVSLPDLKVLNRFPNNGVGRPTSGIRSIRFSNRGGLIQGRLMPQSGLWNLKAPGAEYLAIADDGAQAAAYVAPDDESFVVIKDGRQRSWHLYRVGQAQPIAGGGFGNSLMPWYSPDGRFVAMVQMVTPSTPTVATNLINWFYQRFNIEPPSLETLVYSANTGKLIRRIPNVRPIGFTPDGQRIVTYQTIQDHARGRFGTTLSEWSPLPPSPPWWSWTLSAVLLGALFWPLVRKIRHYRPHAVA